MAVSYIGEGAVTISTASGTTIAPSTMPTHATDDMLVILLTTKPDTVTPSTPSGWTFLAEFNGGAGVTGNGTGPMRINAFYKIATSASESAPSFTLTGNNVAYVQCFTFRSATGAYSIAAAGGVDTTTGTDFSVTCTSDPGLTSGDHVLFANATPDNNQAWNGATPTAITATGATFAGTTYINEYDSAVGNDLAGFVSRDNVSSGTATAAPVVTGTTTGTATNIAGPAIVVRIREVSSGHSVNAGLNAETDTAQTHGRLKSKAVGQNTEADTAQVTGRRKSKAIGQTISAELAQVITASLIPPATGHATETDLAQAVGKSKRRSVGQVTEADTAQVSGRVKRKAAGQVSEVDTAQTAAETKLRAAGQASETDAVQAIARAKRKTLGLVTDTHSALTVTRAGGAGVQTDTAFSITAVLTPATEISQVLEADTARTITASKRRAIGQAADTASSFASTRRKSRTLGQSQETDAARTATANPFQFTEEADAAYPVVARKQRAVGQASETDSLQATTHAKRTHVLLVQTPADLSRPVVARKLVTIAQASETGAGQTVARVKRITVGQIAESQTGQVLTPTGNKSLIVSHGIETDSVLAITRSKRTGTGTASSTATAHSVASVKRKTLGLVSEEQVSGGIQAVVNRGFPVGMVAEAGSATAVLLRQWFGDPVVSVTPNLAGTAVTKNAAGVSVEPNLATVSIE